MSNATHTPGPFVVGQSENQRLHGGQWGIGLHLESSGGANGCDLTEAKRPYMLLSGFCSEADAHRFAAAPELLEALEKFASIEIGSDANCRVEIVPNGYSDPALWRQHVEAARAAIAKAKGGAL